MKQAHKHRQRQRNNEMQTDEMPLKHWNCVILIWQTDNMNKKKKKKKREEEEEAVEEEQSGWWYLDNRLAADANAMNNTFVC